MKEADKKSKTFTKVKLLMIFISSSKKLSQGDVKKAVVKIKDGGSNGYYTFDLTHPLEKNRKNIKVVADGEIESITWDQ